MILNRKLIGIGFIITTFFALIALSFTSTFKTNIPQFSTIIIIDVLITIPVIYFLIIRKTKISKLTLVPITVAGVFLASYILPTENQDILIDVKTWVLPLLEVFVISFIGFKVNKTILKFKQKQNSEADFFTVLKKICNANFPKIVAVALATEISVFYYGFVYWKKRALKPNEFSYHKNSGAIGLFLAFIIIIGVETIWLHTVLLKYNTVLAWLATGLSLYTIIQCFGFAKSILKRPIAIKNNTIHLRYGIMKETSIPIDQITSIEITSADLTENTTVKKLSLLGQLESHNIIITLNTNNQLIGLYGQKKDYKRLALSIDNKEQFKEIIEKEKSKITSL